MAERKKCPDCHPPAPPWVMSFADLMGLLMACFALLLAFSKVTEEAQFNEAVGSIQASLGVLDGDPVLVSAIQMYQAVPKTPGPDSGPGSVMSTASTEIEQAIEESGQGEQITVTRDEEGMTILLRDQVVFDSGRADLKGPARELLLQIGKTLAQTGATIEISGHTDDVPISGSYHNNHWLSAARAMRVLDVLADEVGVSRARMTAVGHGEFRPIAPNDTPENRARNRRVEIRVHSPQGGTRPE